MMEKLIPYISFVLSITITSLTRSYKIYQAEKDDDIPRIVSNKDSEVYNIVNSIDMIRMPYHSPFLTTRMWSYGTMQTLIPTCIRNLLAPFLIRYKYDREIFVLSDGGSVGIDWLNTDDDDNEDPIVLIHHGLAGNSYSEYVTYFVKELLDQNFNHIACLVSRGCGGVKLTTREIFSAAKTSDLRQVIRHIKLKFPRKKIYLVGFSLGAGIVLKYVSEEEDNHCPDVRAACAICPFWNWNIRSGREFPFWDYFVLVAAMKIYYLKNMSFFLRNINLSVTIGIIFARTCNYFNSLVLQYKEIYGYTTLQEYYDDSSNLYRSHKISTKIPTLTINADTDPVCDTKGCPEISAIGQGLASVRVKNGGHLAFHCVSSDVLGYLGLGTRSWSDMLAIQYFKKCEDMLPMQKISGDTSPTSVDELARKSFDGWCPQEKRSEITQTDSECDTHVPAAVSVIPKAVMSAYISANYYFQSHDKDFCLFKINEPNKLLASIMTSYRCNNAVFVTAQNPYSTIKSADVNKQLQSKLISLLNDLQFQYIHGYSSDHYENWHEESVLIFGCDLKFACHIAKQFNQNAFVWVKKDNFYQPEVTPKLYFTR